MRKEMIVEKPYVISEELGWVGELPQSNIDTFRESLDENLRRLGKNTIWVSENILRSGLEKKVAQSPVPVISLDDRYIRSGDAYIGMSRGVARIDGRYTSSGYAARVGYNSIIDQLDSLAQQYEGMEVALADDVVFSGEMITDLSDTLQERKIMVRNVIAGIAIGEGMEKILERGIDIQALRIFPEVEDELCERDFTLLRGSGRRITKETNYPGGANVLYFDPRWGDPVSWMSLPEGDEQEFWVQSLRRNRQLFSSDRRADSIGPFVGVSQIGSVGIVLDRLLEEACDGKE